MNEAKRRVEVSLGVVFWRRHAMRSGQRARIVA